MASLNLQEKANFTRLSRLLVDKGCEALRMTFDAIHPPTNLATVLNANRSVLLKLKLRVINFTQWDLLFPPSGNPPDSKTFDITLLTVLLRNICGLHPPATGWNTMPPNTDNSPAANITRIKLLRNDVYAHVSSTEIDNATFENLWQKISKALVDLNVPLKEIDDLKTSPLSPEEDMYIESLKEWYLKEEDCKKLIVGLKEQHSESNLRQQYHYNKLASSLRHITKVTEETHQGIQLLSHIKTEEPQNKHPRLDSGESDVFEKPCSIMEVELLRNLAKHNFLSKIRSKVKLFHPGTREWLFKKVESWFTKQDESRVLLIKAGPGFGKSVFAAKVCEIFKENSKFAACHFCDYSDSNLKDPMMMIQSLASHMTENIPGYREKLVDHLQRPHKVKSLKDAFQIYLQNPLDEIEVEPHLIVIDGLDESTTEDKSEMVKLISDRFSDLPKGVKVLITSRPEISLNALEHIQTIEIQRENEDCDLDLLKFLKDKLPLLTQNAQTHVILYDIVLPKIVKKCEGSFLYAFHVLRELQKRQDLDSISTEDIMLLLPKGMKSIYVEYFRRFEEELEAILKRKPDLCQLLGLLVAANYRLPLRFVARALGLDLDRRKTVDIINKVNEAVSCILFVSNEEVTVFHKTVHDWLLLKDEEIHRYSVTIADGKKRMWLICEEIYQEIKSDVIAGRELKPSKEITHALEHGLEYLLACNMKESFHWLVDMIIVHVHFTFHPKHGHKLLQSWSSVARVEDINFELRQRISWHNVEMTMSTFGRDLKFPYLELVLDHSPLSCFTDDERETAKLLLEKGTRYVKRYSEKKRSLKLFVGKSFPRHVKAIGLSSCKKLAAVALKDGTIHVVSLPNLVELFQHQTDCKNISCCTFTPDDSIVLYGKLEIGLSVLKQKKISFFSGKVDTFECCAFSPEGKRLVTNDGSSTVKLWDVSRRCLLLSLDAGVPLNSCSFSKTGLFIIGDSKDSIEDSFCVWNAITLQRVDLRSLCRSKSKTKDGLQRSEICNRCFDKAHKELTPSKAVGTLTGIYNEMEYYFVSYDVAWVCFSKACYTTLSAWGHNIFTFTIETKYVIAMINDNLWLVTDDESLFVGSFEQPDESHLCLSLPNAVVWCSFSPDGTRIATYTSDGFINLWYVESCQVYERFKNSTNISSGACWWSTEYLFVCHLLDGVPNLSKYPVDQNFDIKITQNILVPLLPVLSHFLPPSRIQEFCEGYISFACTEISPVKVVNVDQMEYPAIVSLPEITRTMSIVISPGASFMLGHDGIYVIVWKRIEADPLSYLVHMRFFLNITIEGMSWFQCCFSDDLKFAYILEASDGHCIHVDLVNKICDTCLFQTRLRYSAYRVFFAQGIFVIVTINYIGIVALSEFKRLQAVCPLMLTNKSVLNSKLSPNGNILAVPTVTGDMDFFQIFHSGSSSELIT